MVHTFGMALSHYPRVADRERIMADARTHAARLTDALPCQSVPFALGTSAALLVSPPIESILAASLHSLAGGMHVEWLRAYFTRAGSHTMVGAACPPQFNILNSACSTVTMTFALG